MRATCYLIWPFSIDCFPHLYLRSLYFLPFAVHQHPNVFLHPHLHFGHLRQCLLRRHHHDGLPSLQIHHQPCFYRSCHAEMVGSYNQLCHLHRLLRHCTLHLLHPSHYLQNGRYYRPLRTFSVRHFYGSYHYSPYCYNFNLHSKK